jgi:hypothetical protein
MTDLCEQFISFKIVDDPHTQSVDDVCDKTVVLTRYLYNKSEVEISFTKSLFDRKPDDALFWGYELYYSGFTDEVFEIVLRIYTAYYKDNHPMFEGYIRRVTQKWRESRGSHELIGGLIVNLAFCKMSLRSEIDKRQNINLNSGLDDDGNNKSAAVQKYIIANPAKFEMYKTADQALIGKAWKSMSVLCKCEPDRSIADILGKKIHTKKYPLKHGWEYYAYRSPIWKERMDKYGGVANDGGKTVEFADEDMEEEFYDMYGYDLDEQPRHIQNMAMWLNDETPIQMSWGAFCDAYKKDTHFNSYKIKIKNANI